MPEELFGAIVTSVTSELVGREQELRSIAELFEDLPAEPVALVLEGEAGIGKSTLWLAALQLARERGLRVLSSRPAEAERGLAFAGLGDLFDEVLELVLPALSPPRRRALGIALLVEEATGAADPRALGVAVRNALEVLSTDQALVVAVDDVQWLDPSSDAALAFGLRRLQGNIVLLLARRLGESAAPLQLEGAIAADRVERARLGPLSAGAIHKLLQDRLGRVFARPTLIRIHEASGGNPFYALEIARALAPDVDPTRPLPVPETLEELVDARLAGLPGATREALVLASALGNPRLKLLLAAGADADALDPALEARVVESEDGTIRFTHPLLASVLYQGLSAGERRRTHRALAEVVVDPLERARHLALSTEQPEREVAATLEAAAVLASARGATVVAAELGEHALRLTPAEELGDEHRRTIAAGRAHMAAGEAERARRLGRSLEERSLDGERRAETLVFLSDLESGRMPERIALRREALRQRSLPAELRLVIHQRLALETRFTEGMPAAMKHALEAVALAPEVGDDALRAGALAVLAQTRFIAGNRDARRLAEQADELAAAAGDFERRRLAGFCLSHILVWSADLGRARQRLEALDREGADRDERVSAQARWYLSLVELWAGRWAFAAEHAELSRELSLQYDRDDVEGPQNVFPIGLVAAHRGQLDAAREHAERGRALAEGQGALLPGLQALCGLVDAWESDPAAAIEHFETAERTADVAGWCEPWLFWWRADYAEALIELGRLDETGLLLARWTQDATRLGRAWVLAQATRSGGLLAAARSEVEEAVSLLERAAAASADVGDPFGRARALLALGVVRRRVRQKRPARDAIEAAVGILDECGAARWAEKARGELGRIGGRRREEGLTAAEQRVAALVAEGRTNREVAAALVLGERTVETHLTRIYAKLGVRSRTELARMLGPAS